MKKGTTLIAYIAAVSITIALAILFTKAVADSDMPLWLKFFILK